MRISFILLILSLCFLSLEVRAQDQISVDDYKKAEQQLSWNTSKLVDRMNVRPTWTEDGKFWYQNLIANGTEYVLYDLKTKSKKICDDKSALPKEPKVPVYDRRKEVISPDGKKVVYINNWNLFVRDLDSGKKPN